MTADGWLRTGDAARSDEQGYVWIVDRIADRFVSDGRPVYPAEVERVLNAHPWIADAGVVQVPTEDGRSLIAAVVVPTAGVEVPEQELLAFFHERLPPHQAPATVTFVEQLPRNSVGKLARTQLRALATVAAQGPEG
jgi:acyl-coenzyme A synthetase/AMP-(fatty) acid ligase